MRLRRDYIILVTVAIAALLGGLAALYHAPRTSVELDAGTALVPPRPLPAFALTGHDGTPFTRDAFAGRWTLVFTGFTHCPDVCPDTLYRLKTLDAHLRDMGGDLQVVFVSVDSERDTPETLARYVGYFDPRFIGATGTKAQVDTFCSGIGTDYIKVPGAGGDYTVDHSAALVLIDPEVRVAGYFMPPFDIERLAADLAPLLAKEGST